MNVNHLNNLLLTRLPPWRTLLNISQNLFLQWWRWCTLTALWSMSDIGRRIRESRTYDSQRQEHQDERTSPFKAIGEECNNYYNQTSLRTWVICSRIAYYLWGLSREHKEALEKDDHWVSSIYDSKSPTDQCVTVRLVQNTQVQPR